MVYDGVPPRTITTKLERVQVNITPGDSNVLFSHVADGIEFPIPKRSELDQYVVYIGFDPAATQGQRPHEARAAPGQAEAPADQG